MNLSPDQIIKLQEIKQNLEQMQIPSLSTLENMDSEFVNILKPNIDPITNFLFYSNHLGLLETMIRGGSKYRKEISQQFHKIKQFGLDKLDNLLNSK